MTNTFSWRCENSAGQVQPDAASATFPSQADAESWLSDSWQQLADAGVEQVTLLDGEHAVYGPMSLAAG